MSQAARRTRGLFSHAVARRFQLVFEVCILAKTRNQNSVCFTLIHRASNCYWLKISVNDIRKRLGTLNLRSSRLYFITDLQQEFLAALLNGVKCSKCFFTCVSRLKISFFCRQDLLRCKTLTDACKESLKFLVKSYQNYKKSHSLKVRFVYPKYWAF